MVSTLIWTSLMFPGQGIRLCVDPSRRKQGLDVESNKLKNSAPDQLQGTRIIKSDQSVQPITMAVLSPCCFNCLIILCN